MKRVSKFLLITLLLLIITLSAYSATDNTTDTGDSTGISNQNSNQDKVTLTTNTITEKSISKKDNIERENISTKEASRTVTVTNETYSQFFVQQEGDSFVKTTDLIQSGDTVNLKGNFKNVNFAVDKKLTFTSLNKDAKLVNSTVYVLGQNASGSTVANLDIFNDGTLLKGIQVKNSSKLLIENNTIKTLGLRAYGFVADYMTHSTIRNNYFEREGDDWRYITFVIGKSHYNSIANNTILCGGANGIYLSIYGSTDANFDGGPSNHNNITGNNVTARGYITSWCYTIQVMGANNLVAYNTVNGGFRGISTQDYENNTIVHNDVHAINEGIYACERALVAYNSIHVNESAYGVTIGSDNVVVRDNNISSTNGQAIEIRGNNVLIANNTIVSTDSNAIQSKGTYTHIVIDNNKITSKLDGILFRQQSRTKKINHVLLTCNTIVSEGDYAINFEEVGSQIAADVNVTVASSNVLTSNKGTGNAAYLKPANLETTAELDTNQVLTVTQSNYKTYFTDALAGNQVKQNATLYLEGTFNNCSFTFNKKVHIIGKNCIINEGTITLTGDAHASSINQITINNKINDTTVHAIELLEVNNCKITNVKINNFAEYESIGIFIYGANGNTIKNNNILTSGNYVNNAILAYSSDSNTIESNQIRLNQSNKQVAYDDSIMFNEKIGTIQEVLHNHGIILIYSSNNNINNNKVNATSNFNKYTFPTSTCRNSMVGIDIYFESNNNRVTRNNVSVTGYGPYNYGIGVLGAQWGRSIYSSNSTANVYEANNVQVQGGYFATGFIAGRNSVETVVKNNIFTITALKNSKSHGDYAHAITLENSTNSQITNNTLNSVASSVYSIELFDSSNNRITLNTINANATYPYGIAGTRSSNNIIQNNTIRIREVNLGETSQATHSESIESGKEAIMLTSESKNNNIKYNSITTNTNTTIKLTAQTGNNRVNENSLVAKTRTGDLSVDNMHSTNNVSNNFIYFVNTTLKPFNASIGDTVTITANIQTGTTDTNNLTATFQIGTNTIGTAKVQNKKATLKYKIPTLYRPTTYQITVKITGNNFQNSSSKAQATFIKSQEEVNVKVAKVCQVIGSKAKLTANITTGTGGKIGSGQAEFYLDNKKLSTVNVSLGSASYTYKIAKSSKSGVHTIKVVYLGTKDYKTAQATNKLGIQTKTSITLANHTGKLGNSLTIKATLKTGNIKVKSGKTKIYIGVNNIANATITDGTVNYKYTVPSKFNKTTYTLKIVYDGNNTQSQATQSAKIKINPYTTVFNYTTSKTTIGKQATLVLKITNGQTGTKQYKATSGNVTIKLNGKLLKESDKVITGVPKNGTITFKFTAPQQLAGKQNITFIYKGNNKFSPLTKTYTNGLNIEKIAVKITVNKISNTKYRNNVTITGKITDANAKLLKNTDIKLGINGKTYTIRTNSTAQYRKILSTNRVGVNNVSVSFAGNARYKSNTTKTTFTVIKQDLKLEINTIKTTGYGSNVTVKGTFMDKTGKLLGNSIIRININGKTYKVKANPNGLFTRSIKTNKLGTNNLTISYPGNKNYNKISIKKTFKVVKNNVTISITSLKQVKNTHNITIAGKFTDKTGKILKNSKITVKVNNKTFNIKTDNKGTYTFTTNKTINGTNTVQLAFKGNTFYNKYASPIRKIKI